RGRSRLRGDGGGVHTSLAAPLEGRQLRSAAGRIGAATFRAYGASQAVRQPGTPPSRGRPTRRRYTTEIVGYRQRRRSSTGSRSRSAAVQWQEPAALGCTPSAARERSESLANGPTPAGGKTATAGAHRGCAAARRAA